MRDKIRYRTYLRNKQHANGEACDAVVLELRSIILLNPVDRREATFDQRLRGATTHFDVAQSVLPVAQQLLEWVRSIVGVGGRHCRRRLTVDACRARSRVHGGGGCAALSGRGPKLCEGVRLLGPAVEVLGGSSFKLAGVVLIGCLTFDPRRCIGFFCVQCDVPTVFVDCANK